MTAAAAACALLLLPEDEQAGSIVDRQNKILREDQGNRKRKTAGKPNLAWAHRSAGKDEIGSGKSSNASGSGKNLQRHKYESETGNDD
jgi:hypothetical protein